MARMSIFFRWQCLIAMTSNIRFSPFRFIECSTPYRERKETRVNIFAETVTGHDTAAGAKANKWCCYYLLFIPVVGSQFLAA